MPMDGLMLTFVTNELTSKLVGGRLDRVIQPEIDEVILTIRSLGENYQLLLSTSPRSARVHLTNLSKSSLSEPSMFCMLLRKQLIGGRVSAIEQIEGDRILFIRFAVYNDLGDLIERSLIIELMGRYSNLILVNEKGIIMGSIKHVHEYTSRVRQVLPGLPYVSPPSQGKIDPHTVTLDELSAISEESSESIEDLIFHHFAGFSPSSAKEACFRILNMPNQIPLSQRLKSYFAELYLLHPCIITAPEDGSKSDVFPFPQIHLAPIPYREYSTPSLALEAFFSVRDIQEHIRQRTSGLSQAVKSHLERCHKKLMIHQNELNAQERIEEYRRFGELLQANLYALNKGAEYAEVTDFYSDDCSIIRIPIEVALSPAQNAQRYFKLYRKAKNAMMLATEECKRIESDISFLEQISDDMRKATSERDLMDLQQLMEEAGFLHRHASKVKKRKMPISLPMKYAASDGTVIEVGKNALQNERLTINAKGDEYWLHAQKMPGSHVIIHSSEPSESTVREAALLAGFYSKATHSSNIPVDITLRRYVKKPGGTAVGYVTYSHQKTIYVTPDEDNIRSLVCLQQ